MSESSNDSKEPASIELLLGIHPEHVKNILSGNKRVEFRRVAPKKQVSRLWIYETAPTSRIVGVCCIDGVVFQEKESLWQQVREFAGIDKNRFDQYFHDKKNATGILLSSARRLEQPLLLPQFGVKGPPQGLVYVSTQQVPPFAT